jgi:5-carboxymethyl-2-hydroxymuconate isomerase
MPHLVILYTPNLEAQAQVNELCSALAKVLLTVKDEQDKQVFPTGGTRVLAFKADHFAIADQQRDYGFVYMNLRMGLGRSQDVKDRAGNAVLACAKQHLGPLYDQRLVGLTVQVDESPGQVFDGKFSNIHPLFL